MPASQHPRSVGGTAPPRGDTLVTAGRVFPYMSAMEETIEKRTLITGHGDANPNRSGRTLRLHEPRRDRLSSDPSTSRRTHTKPIICATPIPRADNAPTNLLRHDLSSARQCANMYGVVREAHPCPVPRRPVPARAGSDRHAVTTPWETHCGRLSVLAVPLTARRAGRSRSSCGSVAQPGGRRLCPAKTTFRGPADTDPDGSRLTSTNEML
jgi:hypothetical protein